MAYVLGQTPDASAAQVAVLLDRLLPGGVSSGSGLLRDVIADAIRTRGRVGLVSAVSFVWFSTRLFGSLRSVLAAVFDIDQERGIVAGKVFDVQVTVVSTVLVVAYSALSAYLSLATSSGVRVLINLGVRQDVMGGLEYWAGRAVAFSFITAMFFGLYKTLPNRRIRWQTALLAATLGGVLLEVAKMVFAVYVRSFDPGSLYTGTLAAFVIVVFWVYYASIVFILGGEVAQVFELRHVRRSQRAVLED
ncbi:hypothetical protein tb265_01270 [Gemmatimonadetes bacterium T265]|nr:hypothetical protein tb265_01270 [Gemmatimonadetes bacterium T265]